MKSLIKNIKYNRLPKEVLYLLGLLNDDNKHKILTNQYKEIFIYGVLLYSINHKSKYINPRYIGIHRCLCELYKPQQQYKVDMIICFVKESLLHSKYADYKIV